MSIFEAHAIIINTHRAQTRWKPGRAAVRRESLSVGSQFAGRGARTNTQQRSEERYSRVQWLGDELRADANGRELGRPRGGRAQLAGRSVPRRRFMEPDTRAPALGIMRAFHDLRRANATALVHAGVDLKTAQARLGHSDPRLTLGVYAQATSGADRAAAEALGNRFSRRPRDGRAIESA